MQVTYVELSHNSLIFIDAGYCVRSDLSQFGRMWWPNHYPECSSDQFLCYPVVKDHRWVTPLYPRMSANGQSSLTDR